MLTLCHGPDLTELADHLLKTLEGSPLQNPLAPERIVVNNYGMGRWLSTYGATKQGIVANWEIYFLAEQMWDLIRLMDKDIPENLPSECDPMTWSLMYLLDAHQDDPEFELLHRYIGDSDPEIRMLRSWKLCRRIAGVFDQYLVYRPDMILRWEKGRLVYNTDSERWQAGLWQKLVQHWTDTFDHSDWLHRARIQQSLISEIENGELDSEELPERMIIFGLPCMPPPYIQTFVKLSKKIDVLVYLLDDVYFNDSNPLVASLGKEGRDYANYFREYIEEESDLQFESHTFSYKTNPPVGDLLLDHIRRDLVQPRNQKPGKVQRDYSVQVHSCHSPTREVEVLYDQILALLEEEPGITPSDILVMTPNMETYAPVIDAVFGTAEKDLPQIPYTISDRGSAVCGPLTAAFMKLMKLLGSRYKVTSVIEFLGLEPVQEAFGFNEEELDKLERWIRDNRIRWGIDGDFRAALSLPGTKGFSWSAGLNRMVLGYAMKQEDDKLFEGIYPYREIESSDDAELMGALTNVMESLFEFHQRANEKRTLSEWSELLRELADRFMPDTKTWFRELSQLREKIDQMAEQASLAGYHEKIPYKIARSYLDQKLSEQTENGGLMGQGITFSSLVPMRSIPFKVIGMIGMNDGAFPCLDIPVEFDLMNKYKRPGDRSRREGDRHLFLENILSAGQTIYFSYVGQSNRQDTDFSPSVVLQEFLDYIENRFGIPAERLTVKHRLQAFSPGYFTASGREEGLFSYSALQAEIARGLFVRHEKETDFFSEAIPSPGEEWKKLSIRELIGFYQHPARFLLQNRLGIYLREEEISTEDREPFDLSGLEGYRLGQELLDRYLKGRDPEAFKDVARSVDLLPQGWPGEEAFYNKLNEVKRFGRNLEKVLDREPIDPPEVDIELQDYRITGRLENLYSSGLMLYRFGSARAVDLIDLWIRHLVLQVIQPAGQDGSSQLFTKDSRQPFVRHVLKPMPKNEALNLLQILFEEYWNGLSGPFYFFPNSSFAYANDIITRQKDHPDGIKSAGYQWFGGYRTYRVEGEDPYNHRIFGGGNPLEHEAFSKLALDFWKPFFETLGGDEV